MNRGPLQCTCYAKYSPPAQHMTKQKNHGGNIISLLVPDEFHVIIRTTTDEFNVITSTVSLLCSCFRFLSDPKIDCWSVQLLIPCCVCQRQISLQRQNTSREFISVNKSTTVCSSYYIIRLKVKRRTRFSCRLVWFTKSICYCSDVIVGTDF